jgi:hypothetical protein
MRAKSLRENPAWVSAAIITTLVSPPPKYRERARFLSPAKLMYKM